MWHTTKEHIEHFADRTFDYTKFDSKYQMSSILNIMCLLMLQIPVHVLMNNCHHDDNQVVVVVTDPRHVLMNRHII
jgi:hypothetical protein